MLSLLLSGLFVASVQSHFVLLSPGSRGWADGIEATVPCGGFNMTTTRTLTAPSVNISLQVADTGLSGVFNVAFGNSSYFDTLPASNTDVFYNASSTTTPLKWLNVSSFNTSVQGYYWYQVDFTSAIANWKSAANQGSLTLVPATIQIVTSSGDGTLYQCADVVFGPTGTATSNITWSTTAKKNSAVGVKNDIYGIIALFTTALIAFF